MIVKFLPATHHAELKGNYICFPYRSHVVLICYTSKHEIVMIYEITLISCCR